MASKKKSKKSDKANAKAGKAKAGKAHAKAGRKSAAKKSAKKASRSAPKLKVHAPPKPGDSPMRPIRPRTKRATHRRAAMSKDLVLTRAEAAIMERMSELAPDDPRYGVLESALAFKASWVILGEHLNKVYSYQLYKGWGYASFARYCSDEIRVTTGTARKLVKSFQWLGDEAPELIPKTDGGRLQEVTREVPDFNAIGVLADARKELHNDRVQEDAYLELKRAALEGERTASQLRKDLRESIPEELRQQPVDPVRSLRKALNSSVRTLEALREWDGSDELLLMAEQLRDQIAHHMPRRADGSDGGEATAVQ
jgi:hypothetical protein